MASATASWISIAGLRGVGQLQDALAGHDRLADPVVRVAEHGDAGLGREHLRAPQLRRHRRQFGAALLGDAAKHGQFVLALRVVEGALARRHQFRVRDRDLLAQHFDAAVQRRFVEREQQRADAPPPGWAAPHRVRSRHRSAS